MIVKDITDPSSKTLFDITNVRWSLDELTSYVDDGQRAIVLLRPEANSVNTAVRLNGGTRQSIPPDGITLLRVLRNMGSAGQTPGRAIRIATRDALDNENPNWHYQGASATIEHYVFDDTMPEVFYVYPPATGTVGQPASVWVELAYSKAPTQLTQPTNPSQVLELGDQYRPVLIDYVLHRAYAKDASYAGNVQRSQMHLQNFANALQITMKIYESVIPTPGNQGAVPASRMG